MPIASVRVWGRVSVPDIRTATLRSLASLERDLSSRLTTEQGFAFALGGHAHHGGKQWQGLAASTVALKRRLGVPFPTAPLVRTMDMSRRSKAVVNLSAIGGSIQFDILAYNDTPYSGYHMEPSWNHWSGRYNPVRPPVEITQSDLQNVVSQILLRLSPSASPVAQKKPTLLGKIGSFLSRLFRRK